MLFTRKSPQADNLSRQAIQIEGGIPPRYLNKGRERCDFRVVEESVLYFPTL